MEEEKGNRFFIVTERKQCKIKDHKRNHIWYVVLGPQYDESSYEPHSKVLFHSGIWEYKQEPTLFLIM